MKSTHAIVALLLLWPGLGVSAASSQSMGAGAGKTGNAAAPDELIGTWDVEQVLVDGQDQIHWGYRPNDPQFLGRELVIDRTMVRFNGARLQCRQSRWVAHQTTWGNLIGGGFPRSPDGGRKARPEPSDFELTVPSSTPVAAYLVCRQSERQEAKFVSGTWLAKKDSSTLALRIDSSALLVLSRRPADAQPSPPFSCKRASSPSEKAICGSFALASWDRSVHIGFQKAPDRGSDTAEQTRKEQKAWLSKRNACAADTACLAQEMFARVQSLAHQW
jgi:uncharacterized protein YecT (DUF1311 family)